MSSREERNRDGGTARSCSYRENHVIHAGAKLVSDSQDRVILLPVQGHTVSRPGTWILEADRSDDFLKLAPDAK